MRRNRIYAAFILAAGMALTLLLGMAAPASADPAIRFVDRAAEGANAGSSWADAFTDVQDNLTVGTSPASSDASGEAALPPGASEAWWADVQAMIEREMHLAIDSLTDSPTTPDWIATGEGTLNYFGLSVAGAGDVNGDGYADVIVSAPNYADLTGRVYVFHGGPDGLSATPAFTATGEAPDDRFGASVAGAGDVNGDGYADVIVGAPFNSSATGQIYVFHGGPDGLSATPAFTATGEGSSNLFGHSVAGAGDVNGDGYADVIVGAYAYSSNTGRVYVFHGGPDGLNASPAFTATGETPSDYFGYSVAGAGDVNGDGYADVIVGAYRYSNSTGRAYVYHGGPGGLDASPALTATGEAELDFFGASVAGAGDVNGDGYADVIVSAYGYNGLTGRAYVFHGGLDGLNATPAFTATGEGTLNYFGYSVAGAGDVNGDGYADVIVGAWLYNGGTGRAYVYHGGGDGLRADAAFTAAGEGALNRFGYSVAGAGDVNGDGYADVIVGAWGYNSLTGRAYVYHGGGDGLRADAAFTANGETGSDRFGISVAGAGDVNGDGYADVIVGASGYGNFTGRAYVFHGGPNGLSASPAFTATGEGGNNHFGASVAGAGDVNGDGYADIIVGAYGYNGNTGRAYVFHGGPDGLSASPAFTITGETAGERFGASVAGAGDVNGDGYTDIIVGARGYSDARGRAYVFHGGPDGLSASPAFTAIGEAGSHNFGWSVAGAGDVNGDGYADIIVGAPDYSSSTGRVYVYHGGPDGLSASPAFTATGQTIAVDRLGYSVAGAGDVNGDGYADIIVGADRYSDFTGRAYVFHGGPDGLSATPAFIAIGEAVDDRFGHSVAGAGDVNGDGYADVIVSAWGNSNYAGRAYLYQGGPGGLSASPAFTATGEAALDYFGYSVAGAGDVNGDGYAAVIVGAYRHNSDTGRVYVYQNGDGRPALARQTRGDASAVPVQAWGHSGLTDGFGVRLNATSPAGRQQVKVQVEACPPGAPFGHGECVIQTSPTWTDVTTASVGVSLAHTMSGLEEGILYRWRARALYAPFSVTAAGITPPPNPAHGPWRRWNAQAVEADVRVNRNIAPIANAGSDQTVAVNATVTLDGSGSSDPDGHLPLTYGWAQTGGPSVTLSDAAAVNPSFTAPGAAAVLTFTLTVTDSLGLASSPDSVTILVEVPSADESTIYLPAVLK